MSLCFAELSSTFGSRPANRGRHTSYDRARQQTQNSYEHRFKQHWAFEGVAAKGCNSVLIRPFRFCRQKVTFIRKWISTEVVSKPEFHLGYARRAVVDCYRLLYATPRGLFNVCQNLVGISVSDFRRRHNSHLEPGKKNLRTQLLSRWPTWFW